MDFVGNSYNGYLVTDQKMDGGFNAIMERVKLHN